MSRRQGEVEHAVWHYERGMSSSPGPRRGRHRRLRTGGPPGQKQRTTAFRLAFLHDLYGDEGRAMELYENLAARKPAHVNALMNLAVMYEDRERYQEAYLCIERVLADYPNHNRALMFIKDIESSMTMHYDESQERTREKRNAILDTPITDFELSVRSRNCLKKMNINSQGDLAEDTEVERLGTRTSGKPRSTRSGDAQAEGASPGQ